MVLDSLNISGQLLPHSVVFEQTGNIKRIATKKGHFILKQKERVEPFIAHNKKQGWVNLKLTEPNEVKRKTINTLTYNLL